jgi:hypothetical protein
MLDRLIMEDAPPAGPQPFTAKEWLDKKEIFTADDLPRLLATLKSVSAQLQSSRAGEQRWIRLLAAMVKSRAIPLGPITCNLRKATLDALPEGFNLHIEERPDELRFLVQGKIITP